MDLNKKRNILLSILVLILICATVVGLFFFFSNNNNKRRNIVNRSYASVLEESLKYDAGDKSLKEISEELKDNKVLFISNEDLNKLYVPFHFIITNEGVVITDVTHESFYKFGIKVGDVITEINDKKLSDLDYETIKNMLYSNKSLEYKLKVNGRNITANFNLSDSKAKTSYEEKNGKLVVKIYDLNNVTPKYLDEITNKYTDVTYDLTESYVTTEDAMLNFISYFVTDTKTKLYDEVIAKNGFKNKANVTFEVDEYTTPSIIFTLSILKSLKLEKLSFSDFTELKSYRFIVYITRSTYCILLANKELKFER